ncbi:MAG: flagellar hook-basal body complex protein FliE [Pseudomonadota bacterium]|nr:flagellar hook-basal body complex protein FliE [Pseudomonadota bacterium]
MTVDALNAANAYRNQLRLMQNAGDAAPAQEEPSKSAFAQLVETAAKDAMGSQYKAETAQMSALTGGKADLTSLVTAVSDAELSLNTVVAIRDRVINAYNDIIKMAI